MNKLLAVNFTCKEKGCPGIITGEATMVRILTSAESYSPALTCPLCGRLYWPDSGHAVENLSFQKAFLTKNNLEIENRPLDAAEKLASVHSALEEASILISRDDAHGQILEFVLERLNFLSSLNHAADCLRTKNASNRCSCGHTLVQEWLLEYDKHHMVMAFAE